MVEASMRNTFAVGGTLQAARIGDPTVWMQGSLVSYVPETRVLVIDVEEAQGVGTLADWRFRIGRRGQNGGIIGRGEMGVETAIASGGFIYIGTDTCSEDPLWTFYNVTRGRDFIHLMFPRTLRPFRGKRNIDYGTITDSLDTMKFALRDLKADGDIIDYKVGFSRDQNSPEQLRLGKFVVDFSAEEPPVRRYLGIRSARYRPVERNSWRRLDCQEEHR